MIKQKWINEWMNKRGEIYFIEAIQAIFTLAFKTPGFASRGILHDYQMFCTSLLYSG